MDDSENIWAIPAIETISSKTKLGHRFGSFMRTLLPCFMKKPHNRRARSFPAESRKLAYSNEKARYEGDKIGSEKSLLTTNKKDIPKKGVSQCFEVTCYSNCCVSSVDGKPMATLYRSPIIPRLGSVANVDGGKMKCEKSISDEVTTKKATETKAEISSSITQKKEVETDILVNNAPAIDLISYNQGDDLSINRHSIHPIGLENTNGNSSLRLTSVHGSIRIDENEILENESPPSLRLCSLGMDQEFLDGRTSILPMPVLNFKGMHSLHFENDFAGSVATDAGGILSSYESGSESEKSTDGSKSNIESSSDTESTSTEDSTASSSGESTAATSSSEGSSVAAIGSSSDTSLLVEIQVEKPKMT